MSEQSTTAPLISAPLIPPTVLTTTPVIERANRLAAIIAHPGWPDIVKISTDMEKAASDAVADYPGWDTQQMVVLKCRLQAAREHHQALMNEIRAAIQAGIQEARELVNEKVLPEISAQDALDQADYVRTQVLHKWEENETRVPGSY